MEVISAHVLHKYDDILREISSEHEKSERLRGEISKTEDKIIALKLSNKSGDLGRISHVNVKVFGDLLEIYSIYDELRRSTCVQSCKDCRFFLVEVFLTRCLLDKFLATDWRLYIVINANGSKFVRISSLRDSVPILEIVPVPSYVRNCTIEASLWLQTGGKCHSINLGVVALDPSFYFQRGNTPNSDFNAKIIDLNRVYKKPELAQRKHEFQIKSHLKLHNFNPNDFASVLFKHSYHSLDSEMFSNANNDKTRIVDLQLSLHGEPVHILFNKDTNDLKIKAPIGIMVDLKIFFLRLAVFGDRFRDRIRGVSEDFNPEEMVVEDWLLLHQKLRKLWLS